jgi:hypothetical protein
MINIRHTIDSTNIAISNHKELSEFSESMRNSTYQEADTQKIFVWSDFGSQISAGLFENNTWLQDFVRLFGDQEMWPWKYKSAKEESDRMGNQDLIEALGDSPQDMIASLRIRNFDSDDSFQGSPAWFDEIIPFLNDEYKEVKELIKQITQNLRAASKEGIFLYLEKVSILINCDPENSITLTPHLHRDGAYGHLESAIVSFYSDNITPHSSTLFFPEFDFEAAASLKPITAEVINHRFPNTTGYSLLPGSLAIFSGKIASDGSKSDTRGALHMSPEGFFPTRRLVLLFRAEILNLGGI